MLGLTSGKLKAEAKIQASQNDPEVSSASPMTVFAAAVLEERNQILVWQISEERVLDDQSGTNWRL